MRTQFIGAGILFLYGAVMIVAPRTVAGLLKALARLDPKTKEWEPQQLEAREGFIRGLGVAFFLAGLVFAWPR